MTPLADMIRKLAAAGCSIEQIALAVEGHELACPAESPTDKRVQRIREYDRNRKRDARNSSGIPADPTEPLLSISKKDNLKKEKRASRIPADMTLPAEWRDWALSEALSSSEIEGQFARFRDWWLSKPGKDGAKLDWFATWRNWCRTFLERNPRDRPATAPTWRPEDHGLPTSEELRAKYAKEFATDDVRRDGEEPSSLVESRDRPRSQEPNMVRRETGQRGIQSLGTVLRSDWLLPDVFSNRDQGNHSAVSMAGMAAQARKAGAG